MGTAAVISISSQPDGTKRWRKGLCMTSDGFMMNLRGIATDFLERTKQITGFEGAHAQVMDIFGNMEKESDYLFVDELSNAVWISYSADFNPFTKVLSLYEGMYECELLRFRASRGWWVPEAVNETDQLFTVTATAPRRVISENLFVKDAADAEYLMQTLHMLDGGFKYRVEPHKARTAVGVVKVA